MKFSKEISKSYQEQLNWESSRAPVRTPSTRLLPFAVITWGYAALFLQTCQPGVKDLAFPDRLELLGSATLPSGREHFRALTLTCFMACVHISHENYEQVEDIAMPTYASALLLLLSRH